MNTIILALSILIPSYEGYEYYYPNNQYGYRHDHNHRGYTNSGWYDLRTYPDQDFTPYDTYLLFRPYGEYRWEKD